MIEEEKDKLNSSLRLIAKSSFVVLIFILFSKILTYVYRIIIARQFGPEEYGLFSLAVMILGWFVAVFSFGLVDGIIRYVSLYRGKKEINKIHYIIKITTTFLLFSGISSCILLFILSEYISLNLFHNPDLIVYLKWFSISIPFFIFASTFLSILQAFEKINWYSFIRNVLDISVKLIAILIFISLGFKTNAIIFSYILGILSMLLFSYYLVKVKLSEVFMKYTLEKKLKKRIVKDLFSYSWPLMFLSVVAFIFSWVDSFAIGYFKNVTDVGIYNAAVPLASLLIIVPSLFIQLFFPMITKEFSRNKISLIKDISKQVAKWIFLLNLPLLIIMILFPGAIINLFFGPEYLSAAWALRFLSIGTFFYSIFIISANLLSMAGRSKTVLFNILVSSIINLILNILLVPKYGISGAAFSTMITYIIWSFISLIQAKRSVSIVPIKRKMLTILLISLIPAFLLVYIKQFIPVNNLSLILQGVLFFLLYLFLVICFRGLDKNDYMIINTIKEKFYKKGI